MNKDDADICEALVNWFESQNIEPKQSVGCLAQLLGVMIATAGNSIDDVIHGSVLAHESVVNTALHAFAARHKQK